MFIDNPPLQEQKILFNNKEVCFKIQRDDLIDPLVSGNKLRKLKGWYQKAIELGALKMTWVTFGGAFSNHIIATAAFCNKYSINCIGVIRGDEEFDNHYLIECRKLGMELEFVSRSEFRSKEELYERYKQKGYLVIPEGGRGFAGMLGFEELINSWEIEPEFVVHASATATTACGLKKALINRGWNTVVVAVLVLKNLEEQKAATLEFLGTHGGIEFLDGYHMGGYAKTPSIFLEFLKNIESEISFPIDPVYVGKALFALLSEDRFNQRNTIFLHTGGQLGRFSDRFIKALY